jgi:two-component system, OmpR family, phosphate regulon response regulator PhoB
MTTMANILLTSANADLIAAISSLLPDAEVSLLNPESTGEIAGSDVWCFIDWLLSDTSGLELCRRLRGSDLLAQRHITMVLESDDPVARSRALSAGADDYMLGPLSSERLVERMEMYTRPIGTRGAIRPRLVNGALTLDLEAHQVRWQGKLIALSPREFELLALFLQSPDRLFSRRQLVAMTGRSGAIGDERTVDVWIGRLRRALDAHGVPPVLRTVRSFGSVFDTPDPGARTLWQR